MRRYRARRLRRVLWASAGLAFLTIGGVPALAGGAPAPGLDRLIERFNAGAAVEEGVTVQGWVEDGPAGAAVVVSIAPRGGLKLIADPGITITPKPRPGIAWLTELPYRRVDPETDYFTQPAVARLPFSASDGQPVELLVEYAYCRVEFQCFFGEETLTVATAR